MNKVKNISGLNDIINKYDIYILDQWGVMHDGYKGYPQAIKCVKKLYKEKKKIIVISNSSKRKKITIESLNKLGFNSKHFLEVMTSGEMIWQSLKNENYKIIKNIKKNCFHIFDYSNENGKKFIKGLKKFNYVKEIDKADFILACTPFPKFDVLDYLPILKQALAKKMPFICANPDYESINKKLNKSIFCMGTIAELYKNLGGKVFILGKPSIKIYSESVSKINKFNKSKVLAVGDSLYHDIKGANLFGVDSLLISSGIHKSSFEKISPKWNTNKNQFKNLDIKPTYLCSKFKL